MRARQETESPSFPIGAREVTKDGDLRSRAAEGHRMIPAPPILVPPEWPSPRVLDADVAGDPAEVAGTHGVTDGSHAPLAREESPHGRVIPAQRDQDVVASA